MREKTRDEENVKDEEKCKGREEKKRKKKKRKDENSEDSGLFVGDHMWDHMEIKMFIQFIGAAYVERVANHKSKS